LQPAASLGLRRVLKGHTFSVNSLAQLGNGYLVSASSDKTIRLWDLSGLSDDVYSCVRVFYDKPDFITRSGISVGAAGYSKLIVLGDGATIIASKDRGTSQLYMWEGHRLRCQPLSD
jgi:WD40 repeat protein